jgi:hypothetical protein
MSKTSVFTTITPLPAGVTRKSVIDTYHNHEEMIDLNPLVIDRFRCKPPANATAEEFHAIWYTIKDKVSYLPGGLATGSVSYNACFHDLPEGLQTHVYAPLGLDIKAKWSVGGSLPGEPKQPAELGLGIPREGLYLREDVKMKCNIMLVSFVKKTFKDSHSKLVDRLVEKAHILEAQAANERLNQPQEPVPGSPPPGFASPPGYNPHARHMSMYSESNYSGSPGIQHMSTFGSQHGGTPPYQHQSPYQTPNLNPQSPPLSYYNEEKADPRYSRQYERPQQQSAYGDEKQDPRYSQQHGHPQQQHAYSWNPNQPPPAELASEDHRPAGSVPAKDEKGKQGFSAELPG